MAGKVTENGKGRVQVYARTRPFLQREEGDLPAVDMDTEQNQVVVSVAPDAMSCLTEQKEVQMERKEKAYKMDGVFSDDTGQKDVFQRVGLPVLVEVMKGFNGCIFAYGQTGSGKTYSLLNTEVSDMEEVGILPRLVATLFARAAMDKKYVYSIKAAGCQVYNEQVDDLLHPEHRKGMGHNITVNKGGDLPDITWVECKTPVSMLDTFKKARTGLFYAETKMNKSSSRSHAVFQIRITRRERVAKGEDTSGQGMRKMQATCGQLSVVDLAGSERVKRSGVTGSNFKEATNINGSLLALGNVIQALADKRKHVPFRDSKLTRILEGSVGGNCKTSLLVCVSPAETSTSETLSTLEFASRAMCVEVDAKVNETVVEIDASKLAADMEPEGGATYVDEEMMKTFKESEQALAVAEAKAKEQEEKAANLKKQVENMESELVNKDKNLAEILKENKRQISHIDLLKQNLSDTEKKHARELELAKQATEVLQTRVNKAEQEMSDTRITLQQLTRKHIEEQRARQEAESRIEKLVKEMATKQEDAKRSLEMSEKVNSDLKEKLKIETARHQEEFNTLQKKIEAEQETSQRLEKSIKNLAVEKDELIHNLKQKSNEFASISEILDLEKQKVKELSAIQEEANQMRVQLDEYKEKEELLQSKLDRIQQEKGTLNVQVTSLEEHYEKLQSNLHRESLMRQNLETDKEMLINNLRNTEQTLDEKQKLLRDNEMKFHSEFRNLKDEHATEIAKTEMKAREDADRRAQHHAEAIEALEVRARREHEKLTEKLQQLETELDQREKDHKEEIQTIKDHDAAILLATIQKEKEAHSREVNHLRTRIQDEIEKLLQAEERHLQREKELEKNADERVAHAQAAGEAARIAVEKELTNMQHNYNKVQARFMARESRKEDLETIARQQMEMNDMKKTLRSNRKLLKQKQVELDHLKDNVRIFGTQYDGPGNSSGKELPGQRLGDRHSFLHRRANSRVDLASTLPVQRTPFLSSAGADRVAPLSRKGYSPANEMLRPSTSQGRLGSSPGGNRTQFSNNYEQRDYEKDEFERIPANPNRGRPLPPTPK